MSKWPDPTPGVCDNCGQSLQGEYCHICGQHERSYIRNVFSLISEILGELGSWDSRLLRTMVPLLFRPAYLSNEYIVGRRVRYVPPIRLYLFVSLIFFLTLTFVARIIPDDQPVIENTLKELADLESCNLILTTGGTGPAPRDITPEATLAVADKLMPGFGEQMRQISLRFVPTAILSRQVAVIRGSTLIINLPGQPKSIRETLEGLKDDAGKPVVHGIFAAVPYCVDLIGGPYIETNDDVCKAFRPKSAIRKSK